MTTRVPVNMLGNYKGASTGTVNRLTQAKLDDTVSVKDFGTVGDGVADDTAAVTAADAISGKVYLPAGTYDTTTAATALRGPFYGEGQIRDASNNKRAPYFSAVAAAPSAFGNFDSAETAFNGDWSGNQFAIEHRVTGAATLGQPTSGYLYRPEAFPIFGYLYNESGWNNSTSGNSGRTGVAFSRVQVYQAGQGDAVCYNASAFVTGAKAGATDFLANPAAVLFNGDIKAGQAGVYLNPHEVILSDGGFDAAGIAFVGNLARTNATGALGCFWAGVRIQNQGTQPVNQGFALVGDFDNGLDFALSSTDFGTNQAAVSLKSGQRIYFNNSSSNDRYTTTYNGEFITHTSGSIGVFVNGNAVGLFGSDRLTLIQPPRLPTVAAAALPAASTRSGMEYYLSDCNSTTRGATAAGGGANFVKVYSNGTDWIIA